MSRSATASTPGCIASSSRPSTSRFRTTGTVGWGSFFFSSRRPHTRWNCDWSSDVCSSDLRRLARHEDIAVAEPVLAESPRLSNADLIEIANTRSEQHLIAIAGRWWLQEVVTDALLEIGRASCRERVNVSWVVLAVVALDVA